MKIPLSRPEITRSDIAAVNAVLRGTRLSLGEKLEAFERAIARYAGTKYAVAMNSGTSALHVALAALGVGRGDEVIVPSFAFVAVANAVCHVRAAPVFVEIESETLTLDPAAVERAITRKTRAIIAVHTFGCPADMRKLLAVARRNRVAVIEDACEAIGAEFRGKKAGSLGRAGVFAFYPNKQMTTGEGGVLVTNDGELAARARRLRNQGRGASRDWLDQDEIGYSYRLPELNCALGISQLKRMDSVIRRRQQIARAYSSRLTGIPDIELPRLEFPDRRASWFAYAVRLAPRFTRADRDAIVKKMAAQGIECGRYFGPIHLQPAYRGTGRRSGDLSLTEAIAGRTISLPFFSQITNREIARVSRTLRSLLLE
jgi:perosamine synthetase